MVWNSKKVTNNDRHLKIVRRGSGKHRAPKYFDYYNKPHKDKSEYMSIIDFIISELFQSPKISTISNMLPSS